MKKQYGFYNYAIKMRLYPNHKQTRILLANIHTSRFIYNQLVANGYTDTCIRKINTKYPIPKEYYQYNSKHKVIKKSTKRLTGLDRVLANKPEWFDKLPLDSDMFMNTYVNYQAAWNMFHKVHRAGTPKFKSRARSAWTYTTSNHYNIRQLAKKDQFPTIYNGSLRFTDRNHLYLGRNLGIIRVNYSQRIKLPSNNKHVRISKVTFKYLPSGKWQVSVLFKSKTPFKQPLPTTGKQIGFDLNIENFLVDSNGRVIANPKFYRQMKKRLAKEQRILSRRQIRAKHAKRKLRDCKNYQKQRLLVARLHEKIKNQRENFVNVLSTVLIKNHDLIVSENLQSRNMLKNHALAQSISDVGWRLFIDKLKYKAKLYNRVYILVDPKYTTQRCHNCGYRMGSDKNSHKLTLDQRAWWCPHCHVLHVRDWNAALNILEKGWKFYQSQLPIYNVYIQ